jgi:hypothetical protein
VTAHNNRYRKSRVTWKSHISYPIVQVSNGDLSFVKLNTDVLGTWQFRLKGIECIDHPDIKCRNDNQNDETTDSGTTSKSRTTSY